ncbi:GntR family transcriptional regulator [Streptomyces turgidiscabies]|uniref:Transcriptional regulator, GntR family n=1 Tax=Streptomyces turgidiscabies (strain Car8) TaxID=698760 RepID=L7FIT5_STRT8|nr:MULTISPECIES: GntR family transcriptional regulator [Streptomyces]ELP71242.1 transcriptional regulator, GntR family [Streptomyces turgidiscabies Car8]MDX3492549.1 GntR family transcriptional regulator [Streptomyces turgidiscabies]GAQ69154.1 putative HTH-type transcriptional regulator [Streptomyces turgidiscabies]
MPASSGNGAVTRSTLRQQIADALRDEVLAGRLQPGQEFTVKEIAEQYGVSATPVREALVDLSAQGLLEADQHRGFRVHEYSLADFRGMIEARGLVTDGMFHGLAKGLATGAAGGAPGARVGGFASDSPGPRGFFVRVGDPRAAAALAGVRRRGEEARRAAAAGELNILIGYDLRFWRELGALFGNPYLTDFLHRMRVQTWVCAVQHLRRLSGLRGHLWSDYTDVVDALTRRELAEAHRVVDAYDLHSLALIEGLANDRPDFAVLPSDGGEDEDMKNMKDDGVTAPAGNGGTL